MQLSSLQCIDTIYGVFSEQLEERTFQKRGKLAL